MRSRLMIASSALAIGLFALAIPRAEAGEPFDTVTGYTEALRAGDTIRVKSYIGGRLYKKKELLLDHNDEYPEFLRNFYEGAEIDVSDQLTDLGPRGQGVNVTVRFPGGYVSENMAIVEQAADGSWKVIDEVEAGP